MRRLEAEGSPAPVQVRLLLDCGRLTALSDGLYPLHTACAITEPPHADACETGV